MSRLPVLIVIAVLPFACGCGKSEQHAPSEKYFLVASNIKIPYWQSAAKGLYKAAGDLKVQAEMVGPDKYDTQEQAQEFRRVVQKKPAGILVSAADPELLKNEINSAIAAGIPVVTMDSDSPASQRLLFVGTNNYQAGLTGGRILAKQLQGKGNVVVFTIPAQANLEERLRGYRDVLSQHPGISILRVVDIRGDPSVAFDKTIEMVEGSKTPVNAFVCLEATAGNEVAEVLDRRNLRDKVVIAMDTDDATLNWIEKGVIAATIGQRPYTMAYYGLKAVDDLHHHKLQPLAAQWAQNPASPIPAAIDTGATLIDRSNIAEMRRIMNAPAAGAGR